MQIDSTNGLRGLVRSRPSLVELARASGHSYSFITKVAAGKRRPNAAVRAAVERLYRVPASLVFGDVVARPRRAPK